MKKISLIILIVICFSVLARAQSIRVTSPNGGESWPKDGVQAITWTATNMPAGAKVRLTLFKGGHKVGVIVDNLDAGIAGSQYNWTVGQYIGGSVGAGVDYKIFIISGTIAEDFSDANFAISGGPQVVVIGRRPPDHLPPSVLFSPRLVVSNLGLTPNVEGFGIIFSYKNAGTGALPKASEVPVKPSYRVLVDGKETASGSLFIPAFAAPPGWEQAGYFGGWIKLPSSHFSYHMGKFVKVVINENKAMGMNSDSLELGLVPLALKYKLDLWCVPNNSTLDWDTHMLTVHLVLNGKVPSGRKILLRCRNVESNNWYFSSYLHASSQNDYKISRKLDFPQGQHSLALYMEAYIVPLSYSEQILDIETGNNRVERCEFQYPDQYPKHWVYSDWSY